MGLRKSGVLRLLIIIPNFMALTLAFIIVGVSVDILLNTVDKYKINGVFVKKVYATAATFVGAGTALGFVSFLAIYGTFANNRRILIAYSIIMSILLPLEVGTGVWALMSQNEIKADLSQELSEHLNTYDGKDWNNSHINLVQYHLNCCGVQDYTDWKNNTKWTNINSDSFHLVPSSCCNKLGKETYQCDVNTKKNEASVMEGCLLRIWGRWEVFRIMSFSIFCVQVTMLPGTFYLVKMIKQGKTKELY